MKPKATELSPNLFCFRDGCNVYVLRDGDEAIAVDFGSGRWLSVLPRLGVRRLRHVFLTHHHADQCAGLLRKTSWPFQIHAPIGEEKFLSPQGVRAYRQSLRVPRTYPPNYSGFPTSYSVLERGLPDICYDLAGFADYFWRNRRLRFIATPGHGPNALSMIANVDGKQVVFCGDAAHAGATIWHPYHLEWDHWTGAGALAAWEGVQRLANLGMDLLCPSHGPVIATRPREMLHQLAAKLRAFYHAKGHMCPGERDRYVMLNVLACGARQISPHLFQFGENGYLLLSKASEALVVDPQLDHMPELEQLLDELGRPRVRAAVATHYHCDHTDGLPYMKRRHGATIWLHPRVAIPLGDMEMSRYPWLPCCRVKADRFWPERGSWKWNEYRIQIAPFGGQTWWHCAFLTMVDGQRVLFGGDNFQPPSRWNGTGGFCSRNGSRFRSGFIRSARQVFAWQPDIIATGHQTIYCFHPGQFRKIIQWSVQAEHATRALCPSSDLKKDYYLHPHL